MAAAPRARAAAEALARLEFCRLLGSGNWRAGLRLLLREELAVARAEAPRRPGGHGEAREDQHQGPEGGMRRSAAQRRRAQRRAAVARLFSNGAAAGGGLDARSEQTKRTEGGRWVKV
eukprot:6889033-Prymnesium_polylepis.1